MFCCTLLYVPSSFAIILMGKRELVALLSLSSWCPLVVVWLFLAVPWVCLQFEIVIFPDHTHYFLLYLNNFSVKPRDVEADAHVEGNLAAEVSMVALDTLELVIQVCQLQFDDLLESLCGWSSVRMHKFPLMALLVDTLHLLTLLAISMLECLVANRKIYHMTSRLWVKWLPEL